MNRSKWTLLGAMGIFGTIGIFVKFIPLSSAAIAFFRGLLGVAFLLGVILLGQKKPDLKTIKGHLPILFLSGAAIGLNWVLLFESYKYTSVATATVCYYLAPLFLVLASPLLGEKLTPRKLGCVLAALLGLVFVSGMVGGTPPSLVELKGIFLGIGAAVLYASVILLNKRLCAVAAYDKTVLQLGASTLVILPYLFLSEGFSLPALTGVQWLLLTAVGIVHTGIAYTMYFSSLRNLNAHTIGIFSYLDPVIAVALSALLLKEPISIWGIIGSMLILGSALYSELPAKK